MVVGVGDVEVSACVESDSARESELRGSRYRSIAGKACDSSSCDCRDGSSGDFADAVIVRIGDEDVSAAIDCDSGWSVELRGNCWSVVAGKAFDSCSSDRGDDSGRSDFANDVIVRVGDEKIADCVVCD
jgi:hypothetical protein